MLFVQSPENCDHNVCFLFVFFYFFLFLKYTALFPRFKKIFICISWQLILNSLFERCLPIKIYIYKN